MCVCVTLPLPPSLPCPLLVIDYRILLSHSMDACTSGGLPCAYNCAHMHVCADMRELRTCVSMYVFVCTRHKLLYLYTEKLKSCEVNL